MTYEIVDEPERWVVGVVTRTSVAAEDDPQYARLGDLWQHALTRAQPPRIAVLTDYAYGRYGQFTEVVGREVDDPSSLGQDEVAVRVAAGTYARFACEGAGPEAIVGGWREVWAAEDRGEIVRAHASDVELWPAGSAPSILVGVRPG